MEDQDGASAFHHTRCKVLPAARETVTPVVGCSNKISAGTSGEARSLGTQVDSTSLHNSLRTPVTLKSLSTAHQRCKPANAKGNSCTTIPDTRSTASRPVGNGAANTSVLANKGRHRQETHSLPAPVPHSKDSCQAEAPLTAPAHSSDRVAQSGHVPAPAIARANAAANTDTSRVLFTSPQGSVGLAAPYVSPTGAVLDVKAVPQQPAACDEPHNQPPSAPSAPSHSRELTESGQQFVLSQDLEDEFTEPQHPPQRPPNTTIRRTTSHAHPSTQQRCPWQLQINFTRPCSAAPAHVPCVTEFAHGTHACQVPPPSAQMLRPCNTVEDPMAASMHPIGHAPTVQHDQENCAHVGNCQDLRADDTVLAGKPDIGPEAGGQPQFDAGRDSTQWDGQEHFTRHQTRPGHGVRTAGISGAERLADLTCTPSAQAPTAGAHEHASAAIPLLSPACCNAVNVQQQVCKQEMRTVSTRGAPVCLGDPVGQNLHSAPTQVNHLQRAAQAECGTATPPPAHVWQMPQHVQQHQLASMNAQQTNQHADHQHRAPQHRQQWQGAAQTCMPTQDQKALADMAVAVAAAAGAERFAAATNASRATPNPPSNSMLSPLTAPGMHVQQQGWIPMHQHATRQMPPSGAAAVSGSNMHGTRHPSPMVQYAPQPQSAPPTGISSSPLPVSTHTLQHSIPQHGHSGQLSLQPHSAPQQYHMQQYAFQHHNQQGAFTWGGVNGMHFQQYSAAGVGMQQQQPHAMHAFPGGYGGFSPYGAPYGPAGAAMLPQNMQQMQQRQPQFHRDISNSLTPTASVPSAPATVHTVHGARRNHSAAFPGTAANDQGGILANKIPRSSPNSLADVSAPPPNTAQQPQATAAVAAAPLDNRGATGVQKTPLLAAHAPATDRTPPVFQSAVASAPADQSTGAGVPAGAPRRTPVSADIIKGSTSCLRPTSRNQAHEQRSAHAAGNTSARMLSADEVQKLQERAQAGMSDAERERFLDGCWLLSNEVAPEAMPSSRKGKGMMKISEDPRRFTVRRDTGDSEGSSYGARNRRSAVVQQPHQMPRREEANAGLRGISGSGGLFATAAEVPRAQTGADGCAEDCGNACPGSHSDVQQGALSSGTAAGTKIAAASSGQKDAIAGPSVPADVAASAAPQAAAAAGHSTAHAGSRRTPVKRAGAAVGAQGRSRTGFNCPRAAVQRGQSGATAGQTANDDSAHAATARPSGAPRPSAAGTSTRNGGGSVRGGGIAAAVTAADTSGPMVATGFTRGSSGRAVMAPEGLVEAARQNRMLHDFVGQGEG